MERKEINKNILETYKFLDTLDIKGLFKAQELNLVYIQEVNKYITKRIKKLIKNGKNNRIN